MALSYYAEELKKTAKALAQSGKGILAVDESTNTVGKRLASIGVENTEGNRQAYRGMLFTTKGLGEFISGAILFEETLFQSHADGDTMVKKLNDLGFNNNLSDMSSPWVGMNILSLDQNTVIADERQINLIKELEKYSINVIKVKMRHMYTQGGGIHCATLDTVRDSKLESYFE